MRISIKSYGSAEESSLVYRRGIDSYRTIHEINGRFGNEVVQFKHYFSPNMLHAIGKSVFQTVIEALFVYLTLRFANPQTHTCSTVDAVLDTTVFVWVAISLVLLLRLSLSARSLLKQS